MDTESIVQEQQPATAPGTEVAQTGGAPGESQVEVSATVPAENTQNWGDTIKDVPLKDLLTHKGLDEKIVKLIDHYAEFKDLGHYFKAYNNDYANMPAKDLLRIKVERQYTDLTPDERDAIYADEMDRYKVDDTMYSEDAVQLGQTRLQHDLKAFRAELQKEQDDTFNMPAQEKQNQSEAIASYIKELKESEVCKALLSNKTIKIGDGDKAFNMDINPDAALAYLTDTDAYTKANLDDQGNPDFEAQLQIAAFAADRKGFINKLIDHGAKMAKIGIINELGNEGPGVVGAEVTQDLPPEARLAMKIWGTRR